MISLDPTAKLHVRSSILLDPMAKIIAESIIPPDLTIKTYVGSMIPMISQQRTHLDIFEFIKKEVAHMCTDFWSMCVLT